MIPLTTLADRAKRMTTKFLDTLETKVYGQRLNWFHVPDQSTEECNVFYSYKSHWTDTLRRGSLPIVPDIPICKCHWSYVEKERDESLGLGYWYTFEIDSKGKAYQFRVYEDTHNLKD